MNTSAGRFSAVAADPTTKNLVFGGAAGGGVWRSTDGGQTFVQVFDAQPVQAIGAITVDHTGTVWVGTGEGVHSDSYYGQGIFTSTDHGNTWTQITGGMNNPFLLQSFRRIAVDTNNPPHIFAAVTYADSQGRADPDWVESNYNNDGLWRSLDGGMTWNQVGNSKTRAGNPTFNRCEFSGGPCPAVDVVIDPNNNNRVYAAIDHVNVFVSNDGGTSWNEANFPGIQTGTVDQTGRSALAVTSGGPGKPATVYASVGAENGNYYVGFFASKDSGSTWKAKTIPTVTIGDSTGSITLDGDGSAANPYSQSGYDQTLSVVPGSPQTVYFGGVGPYLSTNGGASWTFLAGSGTNTTVQVTHTDQQASDVDPFNRGKLYVTNDGGFYVYDLNQRNWTMFGNDQNRTISSAQIQGVGPDPTDDNKLLAGFQDNGTQLYTGSIGWNTVDTGDAGFALFDPGDPSYAYHTYATSQGVAQIAFSKDGGNSWNSENPTNNLQKTANGDRFNFYPPLAPDPSSPHRVLIGGHQIYASTDGMATWQVQTTQNLTGTCTTTKTGCSLQDIEFVPTEPTMAWALSQTSGTDGFVLSNTNQANLDSGATWSNVTANLMFDPTSTQATGIAVDPNPGHSQIAYLSISGFTAATGVGHIYMTNDFGASWSRADGNGGASPLPDVPTLRILIDSTDATGMTLLAGTDIGVFRSTDGGTTWTAFNQGVIPTVPIFDIEQNQNGTIFAGSHGRGAYKLASSVGPIPGAQASTLPANASGGPGVTVTSGTLTIANTTSAAETISSVTISVGNPGLFSQMSLSSGGQTATATSVESSTVFNFSPPIALAANASATFTLGATLSGASAALTVAYAGADLVTDTMAPGTMRLAAVLLMVGVALMGASIPKRRRLAIAVTFAIGLSAAAAGCGGDSSSSTPLPGSIQNVTAASVSNSSGAVGVNGLPAGLGKITKK
ncbi:MAG: hypothetical protein ACLQAT_03575 [Candidatus Binataceae bacterium]